MKNENVRAGLGISLNLILLCIAVVVIIFAGTKASSFGYNIFNEQAVDSTENARKVEVTIKENISAKQLANVLYEKGLIKDKTIFYFQVILSDYKNKFIAGTYTLSTDMLPTDIMKILTGTGEDGKKDDSR